MINKVIKRDGRKTKFSERRIRHAVSRAMIEVGEHRYGNMDLICSTIVQAINIRFDGCEPEVEQIQDMIIETLKEMKLKNVAEAFESYRKERTKNREAKSDIMKAVHLIGEETERDNANVGNNFSAKLLQIASVTNKWHNLATMPKEHAKAHESGDIHIHDLDSFNLTINCLHHDLGKLFKNGFNTGYGTINPPKRVESAAELACIALQAAQNDMYGGQSYSDFDNAFAPIVDKTRKEIIKDMYTDNALYPSKIVETKLKKRVSQAMQAIVYNLNTMHSRAGSQVPFSSVNIGWPRDKDAAIVTRAFLEEYEKGLGKGEQPIFPNIVFRLKKGVNVEKDDPYYDLRLLAERVAAKRMNPMFFNLDASQNKSFIEKGWIPAVMGCRTAVNTNINGKEGPDGRGNIAPVTMNIVRLAIEAKGDWDKFYKSLDKLMNLCCEELLYRYDVLKKLKVKDLPFIAGQKLIQGSEDLELEDSIEPILKQGTFGIGFIGLAEAMFAMERKHHGQSVEVWDKAYEVVKHMREKTNQFTKTYVLNFSLYGTPAEGLSSRFTKIDTKKYGVIPGVTDKEYYTNSFHIPVGYPISAIDKIGTEAPFHKLCNAGHISYTEMDGGDVEVRYNHIHRHNDYILNNTDISYYGYNFHIRYCLDCGKEIDSNASRCECGSERIQGISRVTGYLSLDERFTPGKVAERRDRVKHN